MGHRLFVRERQQIAAVGFAIAMMIGATGLAIPPAGAQDATPTPTPGVLTTPAANLECSTISGVAGVYAVVSEESEARYRVQEELAGQGAVEAIGATKAVIGNLYLGANGEPRACSRFDVDLRTLVSDSSRRDNYLYTNTLETQPSR